MQNSRPLNSIARLFLFLVLLGNPLSLIANQASSENQIRSDALFNQARTMIRDDVIPSLLMVHKNEIKRVIQNTKVIVKPGGPFEVYVRRHKSQHNIVIGGMFVFLASIQAENMFWMAAVPEKAIDIEEYYKRLLDFALYGTLIDGFGNEFPTVVQYLGWNSKDQELYAARLGGKEAYNYFTNLIMFQILTYTLSHEFAHIYLEHTVQDKAVLSLYERRKNEWHADIEAILAISRIGLMGPTYIPPMGAFIAASLFTYLEDPQEKGTHPTETCRGLYSTDAALKLGLDMLKTEKEIGRPQGNLSQKERAFNKLKQAYNKKKSQYKLSDICDDFVVLHSFN